MARLRLIPRRRTTRLQRICGELLSLMSRGTGSTKPVRCRLPALLPSETVVDANPPTLDLDLAARAKHAILADDRRLSFAADERQFRKALHHWKKANREQQRDAAIVISTYNRAPFVEMNVAWLIDCVR